MSVRTAVVVGNPKPGSRTLAAATTVVRRLTDAEPDLVVDLAGGGGLRGAAVPLMLGAASDHALAPELHLRPLLVELGASVPTPALYVLDREYDRPEAYDGWLVRSRPLIHALLESTTGARA